MKRYPSIGPLAHPDICYVNISPIPRGIHRWSPEWAEYDDDRPDQAGMYADYTQYCMFDPDLIQ